MTSSPKGLFEELNKHRVEVSKLRNALNELDREKEQWFGKKDEISKKIKESIQKIKEGKTKRDYFTQEVKELKPKRNSINKEITAKLKEFDNLKKEKISLAKSLDIKETPSKIKQHIEKLEFKIETEAISFEKEKELMKKIKGLKKLYGESSIIEEVNKKMRNISDEIKKMRKEANESHKSIQEKARQSQIMHEEILKISAEIDKIKVDEEYAFRKFSEFKKKFNGVNEQLKEKLKEMNHVKEQLDKISTEKKEKIRLEQELFLKSKEDAVNEKIKRREKLTTEDLLVFQKFGKG
ncbi:hypothetical protein J4448_06780 [Candidatus Woesearchaeota archaeon]|nr:hypothetical protein [Candidatus Woesearchaeota archaeon]